MGVQLQTGREFASADLSDPAGVVVIDQLYADRYLQGRDPLTSTVRMPTDQQGGSRRARVVGVARTVRHTSLDEQTDLPTLYELGDNPAQMSWYAIRADADPAALASSVRGAVERRFPTARVSTLLPLGELVERSVRQRRAIGRAVAIFGGTTLVLAVLGLYAALAFAFQRRRQELAVRLALGARPTGIVALVLRQGVLLAVLSLPLGVIVGVLLAGRQATLLYQLGPADPTTWISAAIGVLFATAAAAMPAAWAAARVAPQAALRAE
jgi:putative ABC transport system permease protein